MICVICVVNIFMIGEWYVVGLVLLSVVFVYIAGRTVTVSRALSLQGAPLCYDFTGMIGIWYTWHRYYLYPEVPSMNFIVDYSEKIVPVA